MGNWVWFRCYSYYFPIFELQNVIHYFKLSNTYWIFFCFHPIRIFLLTSGYTILANSISPDSIALSKVRRWFRFAHIVFLPHYPLKVWRIKVRRIGIQKKAKSSFPWIFGFACFFAIVATFWKQALQRLAFSGLPPFVPVIFWNIFRRLSRC